MDKLMVTLEELTIIRAPMERCFDLARSVEVHLARNVHCGGSAATIAGVTSGLVGMAQRVTWHAKHFGAWQLRVHARVARRMGHTDGVAGGGEIGTWMMRTESELVLKSRRVVPGRLWDAGFRFLFPEWPSAARDPVARWRGQES